MMGQIHGAIFMALTLYVTGWPNSEEGSPGRDGIRLERLGPASFRRALRSLSFAAAGVPTRKPWTLQDSNL